MSRWDPQADLVRLLEALAHEIVHSTEQDLREPYYVARCGTLGRSASEVRRLVVGVLDDDADPGPIPHVLRWRERCVRPH
jgi:hypothetical protein